MFRASLMRDAGSPELTPAETLSVTAIAYLQPATGGELGEGDQFLEDKFELDETDLG